MKNFFAALIIGMLVIPVFLQAKVTTAATPITAPITSPIVLPVTYVIGGKVTLLKIVKNKKTITPLANVKVTLTNTKSHTKTTVYTTSDGSYKAVVTSGMYVVTPSAKSTFFLPLFDFATVKKQNILNVHFQGYQGK